MNYTDLGLRTIRYTIAGTNARGAYVAAKEAVKGGPDVVRSKSALKATWKAMVARFFLDPEFRYLFGGKKLSILIHDDQPIFLLNKDLKRLPNNFRLVLCQQNINGLVPDILRKTGESITRKFGANSPGLARRCINTLNSIIRAINPTGATISSL